MERVIQAGAAPAAKRDFARVERLLRLLRRLHRLATEGWRRHTAIRELRRLDRRALQDAGIEPHAIEDVVDGMIARNRRDD